MVLLVTMMSLFNMSIMDNLSPPTAGHRYSVVLWSMWSVVLLVSYYVIIIIMSLLHMFIMYNLSPLTAGNKHFASPSPLYNKIQALAGYVHYTLYKQVICGVRYVFFNCLCYLM